MMREQTTFFEKLTMSYAKPLLDSSQTQQIKFEQYGILPDRLKICHEAKKLESHIQHFTQKNPQDRYAFMKGILSLNRWNFTKFRLIRLLLTCEDVYKPLLLVSFITWLQDSEPDTMYTIGKALFTGLLIPTSRIVIHTTWEYFCF